MIAQLGDNMIQQFFNGMIKLMLAKFILNDIPHTLGLSGSYSWVESAWRKLDSYAVSYGIKFFSPNEAYMSMVEHRMPVDNITGSLLPKTVLDYLGMYKRYLEKGPLPNWTVPTRRELENLRAYMAGYHMIAIGEASDKLVNDVYYLVKDRFLEFAAAYENSKKTKEMTELDTLLDVLTGTDQWYKDLKTAANLFIDGARVDKVIAIDAVAHLLHEYEPRTVAEELFVEGLGATGASFDVTPIWFALNQMFDIWFGVEPRRGMSFAEFMET